MVGNSLQEGAAVSNEIEYSMATNPEITLDSFHLGQDIREVLGGLPQKPKITKVLDDGVMWYETKLSTDFKTKIGCHKLVAIRGSVLKVEGLGTVKLQDTPKQVLSVLGEPSKVQDLPDNLIQKKSTTSLTKDSIIRMEYAFPEAHIKLCFFGQPGIREISLRTRQ